MEMRQRVLLSPVQSGPFTQILRTGQGGKSYWACGQPVVRLAGPRSVRLECSSRPAGRTRACSHYSDTTSTLIFFFFFFFFKLSLSWEEKAPSAREWKQGCTPVRCPLVSLEGGTHTTSACSSALSGATLAFLSFFFFSFLTSGVGTGEEASSLSLSRFR